MIAFAPLGIAVVVLWVLILFVAERPALLERCAVGAVATVLAVGVVLARTFGGTRSSVPIGAAVIRQHS